MRTGWWVVVVSGVVMAGAIGARAQQEQTQVATVFVKVYEADGEKPFHIVLAPRITVPMGKEAAISMGEERTGLLNVVVAAKSFDATHFDLHLRLTSRVTQEGGGTSERSLATLLRTRDGEPWLAGGMESGKPKKLLILVSATRSGNI